MPQPLVPHTVRRQWDDETGEPTRLAGFDMYQPTAYNQGKIKVGGNTYGVLAVPVEPNMLF